MTVSRLALCAPAGLIVLDATWRKRRGGTTTRPQAGLFCKDDTSALSNTIGAPLQFPREALIQHRAASVTTEFRIDGNLGEGGFGKVFKATHRRTQAERAVKVLPKISNRTEDFEIEVDALRALDHPHIIKLVECFEDKENYYLVQELCTGPDLLEFLDTRAKKGGIGISERDASVIMRQCLKAVLCCHANGFIHRDIKLENFMVTGDDSTIKMIDFGLATRLRLGSDTAASVGTYQYMAPEMLFLDGKGYTKAVDMWSLGVVLFVLLTAEPLFPTDSRFRVGGQYEVCDCNGKWWPMAILQDNSDGTFDVEVLDGRQTRLEQIKTQSMRPSDMVEIKKRLGDPKYVPMQLRMSSALEDKKLSAHAWDFLFRALEYDPLKRITVSEALAHPFILMNDNDGLDGQTQKERISSMRIAPNELPSKLREFAHAPRLKQIALLAMAHLTSSRAHPELAALRHMFRSMDTDGDGEISMEELRVFLEKQRVEVPADLEEVFLHCDSSANGLLNFVEFMAATLPKSIIDDKMCTEAFYLLDREYNGLINADDLSLLCQSMKHGATEYEEIIQEAEESIRGASAAKGCLDLKDFRRFILGASVCDARPSLLQRFWRNKSTK